MTNDGAPPPVPVPGEMFEEFVPVPPAAGLRATQGFAPGDPIHPHDLAVLRWFGARVGPGDVESLRCALGWPAVRGRCLARRLADIGFLRQVPTDGEVLTFELTAAGRATLADDAGGRS
jgi:hypothetical protein